MPKPVLAFIVVSIIYYSCKTGSSSTVDSDNKDSLLKKYFLMADTLPYYDTNITEFKLLKAYYQNDIAVLKKIQTTFENLNTRTDREINSDSCVTETEFKGVQAEEKYRFIYSSAFCPYTSSITIAKTEKTITLTTLVYQRAWDTIPCKIADQYEKKIDSLDWEKFKHSLKVADFWGLKEDNGRSGTDGSTLHIYGFKKGVNGEWDPARSSSISRWSPVQQSIFESFILLLKISGTRKGCVWAN